MGKIIHNSSMVWVKSRIGVVPDPFFYHNVTIIFFCRGSGDVLFSRDTLPPLVLVVLLGYSTADPRTPLMDSWQGGTRLLDLVGSGGA